MKFLKKCQFIGIVFKGGVKSQLKQEWTWGSAAVVGLSQGLKYKWDIKTGIAGGVAVVTVLGIASGIYNVVSYWDRIDEALKEE